NRTVAGSIPAGPTRGAFARAVGREVMFPGALRIARGSLRVTCRLARRWRGVPSSANDDGADGAARPAMLCAQSAPEGRRKTRRETGERQALREVTGAGGPRACNFSTAR